MEKKTDKNEKESITYQQMLEEVENIVEEISSSDLDLDEIVKKVETGYTLIRTMRERLDQTKEKIEKLREEFDAEDVTS